VLDANDPEYPGEALIDISTAAKRTQAADHLQPMIETCKEKGYAAVEYDNLDSWERFEAVVGKGRPLFGKPEAVAFAELMTDRAHALGLAVAQKNAIALTRPESRERIGFDFVIAVECGRYNECEDYRNVFGDRVIAIEYQRVHFTSTCRAIGRRSSVVLRDRNHTRPGSDSYRYDAC
jgi:hypothetical protein